ncbi:hypothetical protein EI555_015826, partial [Monodon monoceros]
VPSSYLGADQDFKPKMVMMSRLRVILQASPCKAQWRRFQIPRSMLARPCSLYTCTYKTRNRACEYMAAWREQKPVHPLWESVDLVPGDERQSPINVRWRDSVYDPGLEPLTVSYDPTTCLRVWNNGMQSNLKALRMQQLEEDALAMLGKYHKEQQKLVDTTASIMHKDMLVEFGSFDPSCLMPTCPDYWTYSGSLTIPPLSESLEQFRTLLFTSEREKEKRMVDNFRPLQPLMNCTVRSSFPHDYVLNIQAKPKSSTSQVTPLDAII